MADSDHQSKTAKKNAKRKAKKAQELRKYTNAAGEEMTPEFMLDKLKEKLQEAKASKDHPRCGKLRDQIWVLTDVIQGVKTDIPQDELKPILESLEYTKDLVAKSAQVSEPAASSITPSQSGDIKAKTSQPRTITSTLPLTKEEKKIVSLKKKLEQIDELRTRQAKGEKLEKNQVDKIKSEDKVKEEISDLEDLLQEALSL